MPSLYSNITSSGNVASSNFTTLYSGSGQIQPSQPYGNANVVGLLAAGTDGGNTVGNILSAGNVTANYFIGNIVGNVIGNVTAAGSTTQVQFNNAGNLGASADFTFDDATNVLSVAGNITATGNVQGTYFLGNGSQLTGLPSPYGNANVSAYLASGTNTANIITSGNVSGAYFLGNVSCASGIFTNKIFNGTSNVEVASANANVTVSVNGTANVAVFANTGVSVTGNTTAGNFVTSGNLYGNVVGQVFVSPGNANVIIRQIDAVNQANAVYIDANNVIVGNTGNSSKLVAAVNNQLQLAVSGTGGPQMYLNPTSTGNLDLRSSGTAVPGGFAGNGNINLSGNVFISNAASQVGSATGSANLTVRDNVSVGGTTSVTGNITGGNINTAGNVSATGNVNAQTAVNTMLLSGNATANLVIVNQAGVGRGPILVDANKIFVKQTGASSFTNFAIESENQALQLTTSGTGAPSVFVGKFTANTVLTGNIEVVSSNSGGFGGTGNINLEGNVYVSRGLGGSSAANGWANLMVTDSIYAGGQISAAGNITAGSGNFFIGNGSQLTGIVTTLGGNLSANIEGNGFGANNLTFVSSTGNISTTGNVVGTWLWGDGSNISGSVPNAAAVRFPVKNTSGGTLTRGTPIYVTGTVGATDTVEVSASRADTIGTMGAVGLLESTLAVNATGYAVSVGILSGFDTSTFTVGSQLYVGATGGLTQTRPTGANVVQSVGVVGRVSVATGKIEVNIWNYEDLPNLGDGNIWIGNATAGLPTQVTLATYTGNIGAGNISVSGNVTGGNLITAGTISASATSANIALSNIVITSQSVNQGQQYTAVNASNLAVSGSTVNPGRMLFGNGFQGNVSSALDIGLRQSKSRFGFWDTQQVPSGYAFFGVNLASTAHYQLAGNTNSGARLFSGTNFNLVASEGAANTFVSTGTVPAAVTGFNTFAIAGNWVGNTTGGMANVGNVIVNTASGGVFGTIAYGGSNIGNSYGVVATNQSSGIGGTTANIANQIYFAPWDSLGAGTITTPGNVFAYYNPGTTNDYGVTHANQFRSSPNYYFLRNDDNVAQAKLGSLRLYHEFQYPLATSGTVNIDKNNAQVQYLAPTANVTIGDFQNFVTTANDSTNNDDQTDTVTLVIQQGATPYTVTLPTGNASITYVNGVNTIPETANARINMTIQASRIANASAYLVSVQSTDPVLSLTGNITGGNLLTGGLVSATGNITGGNLATTGLTDIGNIVVANATTYTSKVAFNPDAAVINANVAPGRMLFGNGIAGNFSGNLYPTGGSMGGTRLLQADSYNRNNSGQTSRGIAALQVITLTANVTNNTNRIQALGGEITIGGGPSGNTLNQSATASGGRVFGVSAGQFLVNVGDPNGNFGVGNTRIEQLTTNGGAVQTFGNSTIGTAYGYVTLAVQNTSTANIGNLVGYTLSGLAGSNISGNVYSFYHPSSVQTDSMGVSFANAYRNATNYYSLRVDDDVAQVKLGSLRYYHQFQYATATSGTVNIDKNNAQVQYLAPTANVTIGDFQNFVTTASTGTANKDQTDIVTLIIKQGATPYTVTLPTGNASIQYVGNVSSVPAIANSWTQLNIQASRVAGATAYLVNVETSDPTLSLTGNITGANLNTGGTVSATGNVTGNNIVSTSFMQLATYTAAALTAITGQAGMIACVTDSAGGGNPNGMIAFWDTTNARWSYVHDNTAV